ncbi:uncharacterized protein LOC142571287 [Dermacentor variabilis]|uniref:uncharacterized protein LOC142571287 n=1 Tax=Dermacentor variabilis TaxID=34621 RepID=UPI003F5C7603
MNLETGDSRFGLVRAPCSPSMKSDVYIVSAWFERVTGSTVGAHCECVAGLSETCQHVAGLLFAVLEAGPEGPGEQASCTDLPCKWIVPGERENIIFIIISLVMPTARQRPLPYFSNYPGHVLILALSSLQAS